MQYWSCGPSAQRSLAHAQPDKRSRGPPDAPKRLRGVDGGPRYPERVPDVFTADDARQWALLTRAALAARRTEIDELNVFPVPTATRAPTSTDPRRGDRRGRRHPRGARRAGTADLVEECRTLRRAVLLSARGNSGVIMSQVVGGLCDVVVEREAASVDTPLLVECLERGAAKARASVAHPQEGPSSPSPTLQPRPAAPRGTPAGRWPRCPAAAVEAATEALARTPEQLPALARAGVVDAGGAGCVLLLEALHRVVTGQWTASEDRLLTTTSGDDARSEWHPTDRAIGAPPTEELVPDGPAFEVMYLLTDTTRRPSRA